MPRVTLRYNVSSACCLRKLGVEPRRRKERIDLMLPYAEAFKSRMESLRPDLVLTLLRDEFEPDYLMFVPSPPWDDGVTRDAVRWLDQYCNYASLDALHDLEGQTASLLTPEALGRFRRACMIGVFVDLITLMSVLDEALVVVDDAAGILPLEVLVVIGDDPTGDADGGAAILLGCGGRNLMEMVCLVHPTARTFVHEVAHVLNHVRGIDDSEHGQVYADALTELLARMEAAGWDDRVSRLLSDGVPRPPWMPEHRDILDGGRWRMRVGGRVAYATWCRDGAGNWGHGTTEFDLLVSRLPEEGQGFARRSVGLAGGGGPTAPLVLIEYNVSRDCVLMHYGPHRPEQRDDLARPLADEVAAVLAERHPSIRFEARRDESRPPAFLLWANYPRSLRQDETADIVAATNAANIDFTRIIDGYPSVVDSLAADDLEILRGLSRVGLRDTVSVIRVVDECLAMVDAAVSLTEMDVLVHMHPHVYPEAYEEFSMGHVNPATSSDGKSPVGFRIVIGTPTTLGLVAHEAAHVLESMFGHWKTEEHGETFVSYFSQVLRMMVASGCKERVQAVASMEPIDPSALPRCGWCPDLVEDVRWRMSTGESSAYALWCRDGVAEWGVHSLDNEGFLRHLDENEMAFVELATGRRRSRSSGGE